MASTSAAITAVFSTTELTEAILEDLDSMFDLIRAMRVCTKFRDVIRSSSFAQQRLLTKPSSNSTELISWRVRPKTEPRLATFIIADGKAFPGEACYPIFTTNPVLENAYGLTWIVTVFEVDLPTLLRWEQTNSPWLQMLITQPPITATWPRYAFKNCLPGGRNENPGVPVTRAEGVRWADVLDFLKPFKSRTEGRDGDSSLKISVPGGEALIENRIQLATRDGVVGDSLQAKLARRMLEKGEYGGEPVVQIREGTLAYLRHEGVPRFEMEDDLKPWLQ